jgi:hypothetical protein
VLLNVALDNVIQLLPIALTLNLKAEVLTFFESFRTLEALEELLDIV